MEQTNNKNAEVEMKIIGLVIKGTGSICEGLGVLEVCKNMILNVSGKKSLKALLTEED